MNPKIEIKNCRFCGSFDNLVIEHITNGKIDPIEAVLEFRVKGKSQGLNEVVTCARCFMLIDSHARPEDLRTFPDMFYPEIRSCYKDREQKEKTLEWIEKNIDNEVFL